MDKFEKYINDRREEFKYIETNVEDWETIQQKLTEQKALKLSLIHISEPTRPY